MAKARDLERIPTLTELAQDPAFPSARTFQRKYGGKKAIIDLLWKSPTTQTPTEN